MKFHLDTENINYIKITYNDRLNSVCHIKAAIKYINEKTIFASAKYDDDLDIPTPQEVTISFVSNDGLYETTSVLKYFEKDSPYVLFAIQTPDEIEYRQNREYFRVLIETKAFLSYKYRDFVAQIPCQTHDISASGVRLIIPERINEPDEACIDLFFDTKKVSVKAQFVRFDNEDDILKASFRFIDLSECDMDLISQKCIQKQLENKRKTFS